MINGKNKIGFKIIGVLKIIGLLMLNVFGLIDKWDILCNCVFFVISNIIIKNVNVVLELLRYMKVLKNGFVIMFGILNVDVLFWNNFIFFFNVGKYNGLIILLMIFGLCKLKN